MKAFKQILFLMLGVFLVTSCSDKLDDPVYDSANAKAPVLEAVSSAYTLLRTDADNSFATFSYSAADWNGLQLASSYVLQASLTQDFAAPVSSDAITALTNSSVTVAKVNSMLINAGIAPGTPTVVYFRVVASVVGSKGALNTITPLTSNVITTTVTPYSTEVEYPKVWVLGDYNGWSHDTALHLFSYGSNNTYTGMIDFGANYATFQYGFKITGAASWDNATGNWGLGSSTTSVDTTAVTLVNNGGNITCFQGKFRYYSFTFDKTSFDAPTLTKNFAFNSLSIVGDAGSQVSGWGTKEVDFTYDSAKQRFYADVTLDNGEIKFRADHAWSTNWGASKSDGVLASPGDNIKVTAGNYRIYVDMNNPAKLTYELSTKDYNK
jgi:hypothetical protein